MRPPFWARLLRQYRGRARLKTITIGVPRFPGICMCRLHVSATCGTRTWSVSWMHLQMHARIHGYLSCLLSHSQQHLADDVFIQLETTKLSSTCCMHANLIEITRTESFSIGEIDHIQSAEQTKKLQLPSVVLSSIFYMFK